MNSRESNINNNKKDGRIYIPEDYTFSKEMVIKAFAEKIAKYQRIADKEYYKDNPPKKNRNNDAAYYVSMSDSLISLSKDLTILDEVLEAAYKIYDFRNSGKDGYTLVDGKIVLIEKPIPREL